MKTDLITIEQQKFLEDVRTFCQNDCVSIVVQSDAELTNAERLGKTLAKYGRELENQRKEAKAPILEQGREIDATFNEIKTLVDDRVKLIGGASRQYRAILEQKRIEEQRKADEIARKERERIEEQARKQREKEEAIRRQAEEATRMAREATNEAERVKLQAEAVKRQQQAEAAARAAEARECIASQVVAPVIYVETPKTAGVYARKNWKVRDITDKKAAIEYFLGRGDMEFIDLNLPNLNKYAKMNEDRKPVPGVIFYNDESTTFKG